MASLACFSGKYLTLTPSAKISYMSLVSQSFWFLFCYFSIFLRAVSRRTRLRKFGPRCFLLKFLEPQAVGELGFRQFLHHCYHQNAYAVLDDGSCFFLHLESWHVAFISLFDPTLILPNRLGLRQVFFTFSSGRNSRSHLTLSASSHIFFPFFDPLFLSFLDVCLQIDRNDGNPRLRYIQCVQRAER